MLTSAKGPFNMTDLANIIRVARMKYSAGDERYLTETDTVTHLWLKNYYRTCRGDKTRSKSNQEKDADVYHIAI